MKLYSYANEKLAKINELKFIGTSRGKGPIISFIIKGCHHYDIGQMLDNFGIAVRTGHHCTQPVMNSFNIDGTIRISFSLYNNKKEIDFFCNKIKEIIKILK